MRRRGRSAPGVPGAERLSLRYLLHIATFRLMVRPRIISASREVGADLIAVQKRVDAADPVASLRRER